MRNTEKCKKQNAKCKINLSWSFEFWYSIKPLQGLRGLGAEPHMFRISDLEFRIYRKKGGESQ